jgi:hypothetical protein
MTTPAKTQSKPLSITLIWLAMPVMRKSKHVTANTRLWQGSFPQRWGGSAREMVAGPQLLTFWRYRPTPAGTQQAETSGNGHHYVPLRQWLKMPFVNHNCAKNQKAKA